MDHCLNSSMQSVRAHICRSRCSRGAACGPSWFPPGCTWWQRSGRRTRRSCCQCRKPAGEKAKLSLQRSDIAGTDESSHVCFWPNKPFSLKIWFSWFPETNWTKSLEFFFFSTLCSAWCHRHQIALIEKLRPPAAPLLCLQANQITVGLMLKFFLLLAERTKALHPETRRAAQLQLLPQLPVTLHSGQKLSGWF